MKKYKAETGTRWIRWHYHSAVILSNLTVEFWGFESFSILDLSWSTTHFYATPIQDAFILQMHFVLNSICMQMIYFTYQHYVVNR